MRRKYRTPVGVIHESLANLPLLSGEVARRSRDGEVLYAAGDKPPPYGMRVKASH